MFGPQVVLSDLRAFDFPAVVHRNLAATQSHFTPTKRHSHPKNSGAHHLHISRVSTPQSPFLIPHLEPNISRATHPPVIPLPAPTTCVSLTHLQTYSFTNFPRPPFGHSRVRFHSGKSVVTSAFDFPSLSPSPFRILDFKAGEEATTFFPSFLFFENRRGKFGT